MTTPLSSINMENWLGIEPQASSIRHYIALEQHPEHMKRMVWWATYLLQVVAENVAFVDDRNRDAVAMARALNDAKNSMLEGMAKGVQSGYHPSTQVYSS